MINFQGAFVKLGIGATALAVAFAAGRFTMKAAVEKEVESRHEKLYSEMLSQVETRLSERMKESVETVKKELQTASSKSNDVDEKIEVKPDGTHNITRKIRSREKTKTRESTQTEVRVVEVIKEVEKIVVQREVVEIEKEVIRTVEKTIPPPSWRVYGAAAVSDPTGERAASYGAGTMYDMGPVNVGGFGLYSPDTQDTTLGLTAGVAF